MGVTNTARSSWVGRERRRKCNGIKGRASVGVLYFPSASDPKINHRVHDTWDRFVNITNTEQRAQID
jgi:hypothetical protein